VVLAVSSLVKINEKGSSTTQKSGDSGGKNVRERRRESVASGRLVSGGLVD
jgi:hypothetical protein